MESPFTSNFWTDLGSESVLSPEFPPAVPADSVSSQSAESPAVHDAEPSASPSGEETVSVVDLTRRGPAEANKRLIARIGGTEFEIPVSDAEDSLVRILLSLKEEASYEY